MVSHELADAVLPLIRTRADLNRRGASNAHGRHMHDAVAILQRAAATSDPAEVLTVVQRAISSAIKIILRADDSSGIMGDAIRELLALHADLAQRAAPPNAKLVAWMVKFQFDGTQDFFEIDPVAYSSALGEAGVALYREALEGIRRGLAPEPSADARQETWQRRDVEPAQWRRSADERHARFLLDWNDRRLAVLDRDVDAVIAAYLRGGNNAAFLTDTAKALVEIEEFDRAIEMAQRATELNMGHQSLAASRYWGKLLQAHRPDDLLTARWAVFRRWPTASTAGDLYRSAGTGCIDEVMEVLNDRPRDAVLFAKEELGDLQQAWRLAHELDLVDPDVWSALVKDYESVDPGAVLPVHARLVESYLESADARNYRAAAQRLARMRRLASGTAAADDVERLISGLRETHRRRPRLQQEFDRVGLP